MPTVKSVVQSFSGKTVSKREASRRAQNIRRQYQRRLAREISQETGTKVSWKEAESVFEGISKPTSQMKALKKGIESTRYSQEAKGYVTSLERLEESLGTFTEIKYGRRKLTDKISEEMDKGRKQFRRNKMFEQQINQSTAKNGLSTLDRDFTKSFYAATSDIWKGKSAQTGFNQSIMEAFGVNDLETVYKLLTEKNLYYKDFGFSDVNTFKEWLNDLESKVKLKIRRKIVQEELLKIGKNAQTGGTTSDEIYNGDDVKQTETSPEFINRIISRIATALNNG